MAIDQSVKVLSDFRRFVRGLYLRHWKRIKESIYTHVIHQSRYLFTLSINYSVERNESQSNFLSDM